MSNISENAKEVLTRRYLAKDKNGKVVETVDEMWHRIADNIAKAEIPYFLNRGMAHEDVEDAYDDIRQQFYDMISDLDFLPNSPTIMNAGRPLGQLSACFVLPVEDSMEGIFNTIKNAALIHKSGGGTGFSFSRLRPEGSTVRSTGGVASGPISFMKAFDAATESVKQGGCFVAETHIMTINGPVRIDRLKKGMLLLTLGSDSYVGYNECTDPWLTKRDVTVWSVVMENGCEVTATPDHPFMVYLDSDGNYHYKKLCELDVGSSVVTTKSVGAVSEFVYTRVKAITPQASTRDVWNVEVHGTHNYFVCDEKGENGFFVSNTRRGANMGLLRVDHPDIMKFIICKNDLNTLNNFNISVGITDAFMKAVENNEKYDLIDPHTHEVVDQLDASMVFDTIVNSAWKTGEPGIFFIDRVNQYNTLKDVVGEIEAPNPCVRGDTLITTETGDFPIKQLAGLPVRIWNGDTWSTVVPRVTGHNQKMIKVTVKDTNDGTIRSVECTPYHKFILRYGDRIEARKLEIGMQLAPYRLPSDDLDMFTPFIENKVIALEEAPVADHVYCFTEYMNHSGVFNGILTGNCGGATRS